MFGMIYFTTRVFLISQYIISQNQACAYIFLRTIMALWRARALTPEQKVQIADEESEANTAVEEEALAKTLIATDEEIEAKNQVVDEESDAKSLRTEESGSFLGIEDVNMSLVYSSMLSLPVSTFLYPAQTYRSRTFRCLKHAIDLKNLCFVTSD